MKYGHHARPKRDKVLHVYSWMYAYLVDMHHMLSELRYDDHTSMIFQWSKTWSKNTRQIAKISVVWTPFYYNISDAFYISSYQI